MSAPKTERNAEILRLKGLGFGQRAICRALGLAPGAVAGVLYRAANPIYYVRKGPRDNRGEKNPHARLTAEQAAEIRRRRLAGEQGKTLAVEFGVDPSLVRLIAVGKRWPEPLGKPS